MPRFSLSGGCDASHSNQLCNSTTGHNRQDVEQKCLTRARLIHPKFPYWTIYFAPKTSFSTGTLRHQQKFKGQSCLCTRLASRVIHAALPQEPRPLRKKDVSVPRCLPGCLNRLAASNNAAFFSRGLVYRSIQSLCRLTTNHEETHVDIDFNGCNTW
jgi:hypothetical protein